MKEGGKRRFNVIGYKRRTLGLREKGPVFLPSCNQIWLLLTDCHNVPNTKYHGNPSCGSRADTRGQAGGHEPKGVLPVRILGLHKTTQNQDKEHTAQDLSHLGPPEYKD